MKPAPRTLRDLKLRIKDQVNAITEKMLTTGFTNLR